MMAEMLVLVVLPALLAAAAGWDVASYTIPNALQAALIASFVVFVFAAGFSPGEIGSHLLAGVLGLLVGFTLFALGYVGGGDAKLFACTVLWFGFADFPKYALIATVLGGAFAVLLVIVRSVPLPDILMKKAWIARLHSRGQGIPYGVALAAGAFLVLPQTEIFRIAAAG
jgi:prepilin peptidase CpaA